MVLASGLSFVMLGFGGLGGLINMAYGMNAMVHNTSWVTAHFHLIYGGTVVIMYFAIAYEIWPRLTGRQHESFSPLRWQLWLWFVGMMVMTLPWHWLGLQGQWRRVANFNYDNPIIASWGPLVIVSLAGGVLLLASASFRSCRAGVRGSMLSPQSAALSASCPAHRRFRRLSAVIHRRRFPRWCGRRPCFRFLPTRGWTADAPRCWKFAPRAMVSRVYPFRRTIQT
jgi:heme/copper-type cytochrome/quinol oxidase subunit 1